MPLAQITRPLIGLATAIVAYWAYALVAVPLIEPPAASRMANKRDSLVELAPHADRYQQQLSGLLPAGSWEFDNPKVLESEDVLLLLKDYRPMEDGRLEVKPCTAIFYPGGRHEGGEKPVVLRAEQGALLQFDEPLDLRRAKFGKLIGGLLTGEVHIFRGESSPGAGDDLDIKTRNVQMAQDRVWTPHDVLFRTGRSHGSGRDLIIRLLPGKGGSHGPTIGGVRSVELVHVTKFHLESNRSSIMPNVGSRPAAGNQRNSPFDSSHAGDTPIEVTCHGPFVFDLEQNLATFEENVAVYRHHPNGESDQLNCELLELHFARRQPEAPPAVAAGLPPTMPAADGPREAVSPPPGNDAHDGPVGDLEIVRVVATGHPVIVRSPSAGANARGERLEYIVATQRIRLDSQQQVSLKDGQREILAPHIQYEPAEDGGMGRIFAGGPGSFRGPMRDGDPQELRASWRKELRFRPDGENQVLSLVEAADVSLPGMGGIQAGEIHLWLLEDPTASASRPRESNPNGLPGGGSLVPERMMALGSVQINSQQLTGATDRLEAWFQTVPTPDANTAVTPVGQSPAGQPNLNPPATGQPAPPTAGLSASGFPSTRPTGEPPTSRFDIQGKVLQLQIVRQGATSTLEHVTVDGNVRFSETVTTRPDEAPLVVTGNVLHVHHASLPDSQVQVRGAPAHVEARGMTLDGEIIQLHRGANRLWIDGPGRLTAPVSRDLNGGALATPQRLAVDWRGSMNFDGQQMSFRQGVFARTQQQQARSEELDVILNRAVSFAESSPEDAEEIDLREAIFRRDVMIENRSMQGGLLTSIDRMRVKNMRVNQQTGQMMAEGPGWVSSVRRGDDLGQAGLGLPGRAQPAPRAPAATAAGSQKLTYLHVAFTRGISGSMTRRQVQFHEQVKVTYGPVADWSQTLHADDPNGLGEQGVLMNCDLLTLVQMTAVGPANANGVPPRAPIEMTAVGNTLVEGETFTARAERISYTEAKNLLVLEGSGRTDAELWRQERIGAEPSHVAAGKILFWRDTNQVDVQGGRLFEINQLGRLPGSQTPER